MKKILFLFVMLIAAISASAETYRVFVDAQTRRETNFTVNVQPQSNSITINGTRYSYKPYGSIYNQAQGMTFISGAYSSSDKMFCVSTSQISLQVSPGKIAKGYVMIIDGKGYLALKTGY